MSARASSSPRALLSSALSSSHSITMSFIQFTSPASYEFSNAAFISKSYVSGSVLPPRSLRQRAPPPSLPRLASSQGASAGVSM